MKIKELQAEIAEYLIFMADYYSDMEQDVDEDLRSKLYDIICKAE